MVAFSGEVVDPESADFPLTERNLNPDLKQATDLLKRAKQSGDAVLIANAESEQRDAKGRKDSLDLFKKDLGTFARFYEFGSGKSREKELEPLSLIIARMNDLFAAEHLSDADLVSYAETIAAKVRENSHVMAQVRNNTAEQTMLGDFPKAVEDAVLASGDAHHELMTRYLANKAVQTGFARLLLEMLCKPA
jgi:type I restriction enzyme R subunit